MKLLLLPMLLAGTFATSAHATTTDWGSHGPLEVAATITTTGLFADDYLFTVAGPSALFSTAVSNNLGSVLGIGGGTVDLFAEAGAVDTLVGTFLFDGTSGSTTHTFGTLASGAYYYLVSGQGTGSLGGFYSLTSTVSAVPEPETAALLLGGLGIMLFIARRRQS